MRRLLTVNQVAARLSVSTARCYELARLQILPSIRLGRQLRFDEEQLQRWIAEGGKALPGGWRREPAEPSGH